MRQRSVSRDRIIHAPAQNIFQLLADPSQHPAIDSSGTVRSYKGQQTRLALGSTFAMEMKLWLPYRIKSRVFEFEENRLITWGHFGGHRWRYSLQDDPAGTLVTETFDWSTSIFPWAIELFRFPTTHPDKMEATLERIANLVES
tara:strand:- start:1211 stop:1642 length:432 start_codon:yes stop_codon:yes gene_type:complete